MNTLVLAAGRSRRFGIADKLLAPAPYRPLIVTTLQAVLAATRGPVVVVLGARARAIRRALAAHGVTNRRLRLVCRWRSEGGMAGSLTQGLAACARLDSALVIHLADMPAYMPRHAAALRPALHHGAEAARPVHDGRPGHPVRIRRRALARPLSADTGLKAVLATLGDGALASIPADASVVFDIDRPRMIRTRNHERLAIGRARLSEASIDRS